jgi:hypothetical protein
MVRRALRPAGSQNVRNAFGLDETDRRENMEASENAGRPGPGRGSPALHRIDPDRVAETLSSGSNTVGFARLNLMVGTIFERLVAPGGADGR